MSRAGSRAGVPLVVFVLVSWVGLGPAHGQLPPEPAAGPPGRSVSVSEALASREWAQVFVLPRQLGGTRQLFAPLVAAGADGVFLRAFHLKGDRPHEEALLEEEAGVYFATRAAPVVADRLASDCASAHAQGLECWAWLTTRKTPTRRLHDAQRDVEWDAETAEFRTVPELDVFDPTVVRLLQQLVRDAARAGADGVLLQDDFMMRQLEGFSLDARRAWRRSGRGELNPEALVRVKRVGGHARVEYREPFWDFARFKRDRLLDVAEGLRDAGRAENPSFDLALNLYYETALNPRFGLAWFSQDLEAAAARDFRWLAIMGYHRQMADELNLDDAALDEALGTMAARLETLPGARDRVLVKLQTIDWRTREPVPPAELARVAARFRSFARCVAPADDPTTAAAFVRALASP